MKAEEDEDDEVTIGVPRYPCLPSLVALQQMRNRLRMAHDGKRLMKWSAMATGRELRKIAEDIEKFFQAYADDVKDCFILLARCRYFFDNFNVTVLESVAKQSVVTVGRSMKGVSGVRVSLFEVLETKEDPYPYLGLGRGGEKILETKIAWRELLKRLIMILQLRNTFRMLDVAHANATKKANVLGKIIIPKTEVTIKYILSELEELEREEFFRLKKVQEVKKKRSRKKGEKDKPGKPERKTCAVCSVPLDSEERAKEDAKRVSLRKQLDQILKIMKDYEDKGIKSASVTQFKIMAEELREKLKPVPMSKDVDQTQVCKACRNAKNKDGEPCFTESATERYIKKPAEEETANSCCDKGVEKKDSKSYTILGEMRAVASKVEQKPEEPEADCCQKGVIKKDSKMSTTGSLKQRHAVERRNDSDLGVFETDVKEIIKIVRTLNEDGTITEQKKVIRIKKEVRNPSGLVSRTGSNSRVMYQSSETSNKSNPYFDKNTIGVVTIAYPKRRRFDILPREVQSYHHPEPPAMADPVTRYCVSSASMVPIDHIFEEICASLISVTKNNEEMSSDLRQFVTSSTEFEQSLDSFEPVKHVELSSTAMMHEESFDESILTNSEYALFSVTSADWKVYEHSSTSDSILTKTSNNDVKKNTSLFNLHDARNELVNKCIEDKFKATRYRLDLD